MDELELTWDQIRSSHVWSRSAETGWASSIRRFLTWCSQILVQLSDADKHTPGRRGEVSTPGSGVGVEVLLSLDVLT